jgi:hypothetical protein
LISSAVFDTSSEKRIMRCDASELGFIALMLIG